MKLFKMFFLLLICSFEFLSFFQAFSMEHMKEGGYLEGADIYKIDDSMMINRTELQENNIEKKVPKFLRICYRIQNERNIFDPTHPSLRVTKLLDLFKMKNKIENISNELDKLNNNLLIEPGTNEKGNSLDPIFNEKLKTIITQKQKINNQLYVNYNILLMNEIFLQQSNKREQFSGVLQDSSATTQKKSKVKKHKRKNISREIPSITEVENIRCNVCKNNHNKCIFPKKTIIDHLVTRHINNISCALCDSKDALLLLSPIAKKNHAKKHYNDMVNQKVYDHIEPTDKKIRTQNHLTTNFLPHNSK